MKEQWLYVLFFMMLLCGCQKTERLSEEKMLQDSISYYLQQSFDFKHSDQEIAYTVTKAHQLIKQSKIDSLYIVNNFFVSYAYDNIGEKELFRKINREMVVVAQKRHDSINLARAFSHLGESYCKGINIDSAFFYFTKAEKIYLKKRDDFEVGRTNLKMAEEKYYLRDYFGSEKSAVVASNHFSLEKNVQQMFETYNLLGVINIHTKDFSKAEEYLNKAFKLVNANSLEFSKVQSKATVLSNLSFLNFKKKNYEQSLNFNKQALNEPNLKEENLQLYSTLFSLRGKANFELKNYSMVANDLYKALVLRKKLKLFPSIAESEVALANYYDAIKEKDSSLAYIQSAYKNAKESGILSLQIEVLDALVKIDGDNFGAHYKERIELSDSLIASERKIAEKFARIEFETHEVISEKEKAIEEKRLMELISGLVILLGGLLFVIIWQRNRQKQLILMNEQQKASEEIYRLILDQQIKVDEGRKKEKSRIARELHDGVMNRLAGIRFNLFRLEKKRDDETIDRCLEHVAQLHQVEKEIRNIAHDLNDEAFLPDNNYALLLRELAKENEYDGISVTLNIQDNIIWESVSSVTKMNCYRIIQESLNNIRKHAGATQVCIVFRLESNRLVLEISDNGIGFDLQTVTSGLGLSGIQERIKSMNGRYTLVTEKKKGATTIINIPL